MLIDSAVSRATKSSAFGRQAFAPAGALENHANNSSPAHVRRRARFQKRDFLRSYTSLKRVAFCGRFLRSTASGVTLRHNESSGAAGFAGLQHCGSVWACPVCSSRILVQRALEIGQLLASALSQGHQLGFFTLTMRHNSRQELEELWAAASKGWARVTGGKTWIVDQSTLGVDGWIRVWEVTKGKNGWHVHIHGVMVMAPTATADDLDQLMSRAFKRWSSGLEAAGLEAPRRIGQDWHLVEGDNAAAEVGSYLSKITDTGAALGLELTHSEPGRSRRGLATAPVWQLLEDAQNLGDGDALADWLTWEKVSKGKRQVAYSKGLRERFAPDIEELTDEELANEELGTKEDDLLHFFAEEWAKLSAIPQGPVTLLELVEGGGLPAARAFLDLYGIRYYLIAAPTRGASSGGEPSRSGAAPPGGALHGQRSAVRVPELV